MAEWGRYLQLNGQRSAEVTSEIGVVMLEKHVRVAMLQEPYVSERRVSGLPECMRVLAATGSPSAAIVVNDPSADVMGLPSRTNEYAACVWMKDQAGERYVASVDRSGG
ncbi:hypothetical protein QE152_g31369 [Popillia japonica]|uniref:Uncharacterized protein n=1 Tax=Popillia japonica TaxID=7064 RepID=A0AAW1J2M6_POPJA